MVKIYEHSGAHLFLLLWKASHAVMAYDQKSIRAAGFSSISDFAVLEVLLHKGALPINTIGEKVMLTSGSITTAIQRLEKKSLVSRERGVEDARVVLIRLTEVGRSLIETAFAEHSENLDQLFAVLDEEERALYAELTRKLGLRAIALKT